MAHRPKLAPLALAVLLLTAGCSGLSTAGAGTDAGAPVAPDATAPGGDPGRTIEVAASGQVETAPDRAVVRVAVTGGADDVSTVREQLAANASRLRAALREAGVDPDGIRTANYDIGRNYRHDDDPRAPEYRGHHGFVITLDNTSRAGEVVVTAVENGATRVEEVRFTLSNEKRRDLRRDALGSAVTNAREQATVAAENAGLGIAGVERVRTAEVSVDPFRRERVAFAAAAGDGGGAPTSFEGGTVTVSAQVLVTYNATQD